MSLRIENFYEPVCSLAPLNTNASEKYENCIFETQQTDKISDKRAKTKEARQKAIKSGKLIYNKESTKETYLFRIIKLSSKLVPAYYEYTANGKETIYQIKQKFGIKNHAIEKFNTTYKESEYSDACYPTSGTKIRFYASDVE